MKFPIDNINIRNEIIRPTTLVTPANISTTPDVFFTSKSNTIKEEGRRPISVNFIIVTDKTLSVNSSFVNKKITRKIADRLNMIHPPGQQNIQNPMSYDELDVTDMYNLELLHYLYMLDKTRFDVSYQFVNYFGSGIWKPMITNSNKNTMPSVDRTALPEALREYADNTIKYKNLHLTTNTLTSIDDMVQAAIDNSWYTENLNNKVILISDFISDRTDSALHNESILTNQYSSLNRAREISIVRLNPRKSGSDDPAAIIKNLQFKLNQPLKQYYVEYDSLPRRWISPLENNNSEALFFFYPFTDDFNREVAKGTIEFAGDSDCIKEIRFCKGDNSIQPDIQECQLSINNSTTLFLNQTYCIKNNNEPLHLSLYADNFMQLDHNYFVNVSWISSSGIYSKRYPIHMVILPSMANCEILNVLYFIILVLLTYNFILYSRTFYSIFKNRNNKDFLKDNHSTFVRYNKSYLKSPFMLFIVFLISAIVTLCGFSGIFTYYFLPILTHSGFLSFLFIVKSFILLVMSVRYFIEIRYS